MAEYASHHSATGKMAQGAFIPTTRNQKRKGSEVRCSVVLRGLCAKYVPHLLENVQAHTHSTAQTEGGRKGGMKNGERTLVPAEAEGGVEDEPDEAVYLHRGAG